MRRVNRKVTLSAMTSRRGKNLGINNRSLWFGSKCLELQVESNKDGSNR